ncbi:MAG: transcriptional regulator [Gemmatimonadetes bacterium]|nr:transcriptional regulator [Gemmatimonadota bacterium]MYH53982.1 transcriptional regulator [Gemmatimonadota bacterium]MYK67213.1 transcriptional regulator [Gemmatimonadota bacterium]
MTIRPIRNENDYDEALAEIDRLMGVDPGTPESDRLEVLVTLVERYESEHWAMDAPDPISAISHVMEARGLRQRDLAELIGSQSHASEVLRRRRPLSLAMIRMLAAEWGLPADVLVRDYELATP